jgi:hypothetical protein
MIDMVDPSFTPTRRVKRVVTGYIVYVKPAPIMGDHPEGSVFLTPEQYERYLRWCNGLAPIKQALPELSDSERQIVMTGFDEEDLYKLRDDKDGV